MKRHKVFGALPFRPCGSAGNGAQKPFLLWKNCRCDDDEVQGMSGRKTCCKSLFILHELRGSAISKPGFTAEKNFRRTVVTSCSERPTRQIRSESAAGSPACPPPEHSKDRAARHRGHSRP